MSEPIVKSSVEPVNHETLANRAERGVGSHISRSSLGGDHIPPSNSGAYRQQQARFEQLKIAVPVTLNGEPYGQVGVRVSGVCKRFPDNPQSGWFIDNMTAPASVVERSDQTNNTGSVAVSVINFSRLYGRENYRREVQLATDAENSTLLRPTRYSNLQDTAVEPKMTLRVVVTFANGTKASGEIDLVSAVDSAINADGKCNP